MIQTMKFANWTKLGLASLTFMTASFAGAQTSLQAVEARMKAANTAKLQELARQQIGGPYPNGFVENDGQWNSEARFLSSANGVDTWVTNHGIRYDFHQTQRVSSGGKSQMVRTGHVIDLQFVGSAPATVSGLYEGKAKLNYLTPAVHATNVPVFGEAKQKSIYPGVDLRLYNEHGSPRYDLIVAPGADPSQIRFRYNGVNSQSVIASKTVQVGTSLGPISVSGLLTYQGDKSHAVASSFVSYPDGTIGFSLAAYDKTQPLVIDPIIFSTLVTGIGKKDEISKCLGVAVDEQGFSYVTGITDDFDFPNSLGSYQSSENGLTPFVTKFKQDGTDIVYSSFVGGRSIDFTINNAFLEDRYRQAGIVVTTLHQPVIAGEIIAPDLQTTSNAAQKTFPGGISTFIARLSADGTKADLVSYWGSGGEDYITGLAIDSTNRIYLAGQTKDGSLPTTASVQQKRKNPIGRNTGFVTCFNTGGSVHYSTYIGGSVEDNLTGLAVDQSNNAYVVGRTLSPDFPIVGNSKIQNTNAGLATAFVAKIAPNGGSFVYATTYGGLFFDEADAVSVDSSGNAYIAGQTLSQNFPLSPGAAFHSHTGTVGNTNYVCEINASGTDFVYSTLTGGGGIQTNVAVDSNGQLYVGGFSNPTWTPTWYIDGVEKVFGEVTQGNIVVTSTIPNIVPDQNVDTCMADTTPEGNAYVQLFSVGGTILEYGSYYGGTQKDVLNDLKLDRWDSVYLAGYTSSFANFPTKVSFGGVYAPDNISWLPTPAGLNVAEAGFLSKLCIDGHPYMGGAALDEELSGVDGDPANQLICGGSEVLNADYGIWPSFPWDPSKKPYPYLMHITSSNPNVIEANDLTINSLPGAVDSNLNPVDIEIPTADVITPYIVGVTFEADGSPVTWNQTVAPYLAGISLSVSEVYGGVKLFAVAQLNGHYGGTVRFTSADTTKATLSPGQVTLAKNNYFGTTDVLTSGVDSPTYVQVSGKMINPNLQYVPTALLHLLPATLDNLRFFPGSVVGGGATKGVISLKGVAGPTPIQVKLAITSATTTATLSSNLVTFQTGQDQATFSLQTRQVAASANITVTATQQNNGATTSDTLVVIPCALTSLNLPASVLGGTQTTGSVSLSPTASTSGIQINLTSSNQTVMPMPNKITSAPNSSTAIIPVNTYAVGTDLSVTVSATAGPNTVTGTVVVAHESITLSLDPGHVIGGFTNFQGNVTLASPAPSPHGFTVSLTSSAPSALSVPPALTFAKGATSLNFTATSHGVATTTSVTVTATIPAAYGVIKSTFVASIHPVPLKINLPATAVGGNLVHGTVSMLINTSSPTVVTLTSSDPSATPSPSQVTLPAGSAGSASAPFTLSTSQVSVNTPVTITGTIPNGDYNTAQITLQPVSVFGITLSINPATVTGGNNAVGTVNVGAVAPANGFVVTLAKDPQAAGSPYIGIPSTVIVPAGKSTVTFAITTQLVPRTLSTSIVASSGPNTSNAATITLTSGP